ncbi:MAG: PTS sugar transporter subunit IIA [Candidatus Binatia bacterium]
MKITDFLNADMVIPDLRGTDKDSVLKEMVEWMISHQPSIDGQKALAALREREKDSSTAIGDGVAIPHAKMAGIRRVSGLFARSAEGVDFDSLDGGPTYLFFLLIAPEDSPGDHLKALARISRLLKHAEFRAGLRKGKTAEEIFSAIRDEDEKL